MDVRCGRQRAGIKVRAGAGREPRQVRHVDGHAEGRDVVHDGAMPRLRQIKRGDVAEDVGGERGAADLVVAQHRLDVRDRESAIARRRGVQRIEFDRRRVIVEHRRVLAGDRIGPGAAERRKRIEGLIGRVVGLGAEGGEPRVELARRRIRLDPVERLVDGRVVRTGPFSARERRVLEEVAEGGQGGGRVGRIDEPHRVDLPPVGCPSPREVTAPAAELAAARFPAIERLTRPSRSVMNGATRTL